MKHTAVTSLPALLGLVCATAQAETTWTLAPLETLDGFKVPECALWDDPAGYLFVSNIEAPAGVVAELERQTRMNEDVIRYMTVRVDEHEKGPSVMMRKQERSDRGDRGGFGDRPDRGPRPDRGDREARAPRAQEEI